MNYSNSINIDYCIINIITMILIIIIMIITITISIDELHP